MFEKQSPNSRRLLVMFVATTVVPAVSLAWLGWRMVDQDRLLESNRLQERRDQAAELAAAAMQRILAEVRQDREPEPPRARAGGIRPLWLCLLHAGAPKQARLSAGHDGPGNLAGGRKSGRAWDPPAGSGVVPV